jgi:hypothetical protein
LNCTTDMRREQRNRRASFNGLAAGG